MCTYFDQIYFMSLQSIFNYANIVLFEIWKYRLFEYTLYMPYGQGMARYTMNKAPLYIIEHCLWEFKACENKQ